MISEFNIIRHNGIQYIKDVTKAIVPSPFRGRPVLKNNQPIPDDLIKCCPVSAITNNPFCLDLGKCVFCAECSQRFPDFIQFTNDHKISVNNYEDLVIKVGFEKKLSVNQSLIRPEIKNIFKKSLKLRQVSSAGDNASEWELNACGNPNFDMGRFGIEFVASPRHADGVVITGPISENMAEALEITFKAIPEPRLVILCGADAISGGIFADSPALNRTFLEKYPIDLYIPGNPPHPLTVINGLLELTRL